MTTDESPASVGHDDQLPKALRPRAYTVLHDRDTMMEAEGYNAALEATHAADLYLALREIRRVAERDGHHNRTGTFESWVHYFTGKTLTHFEQEAS